RGTDDPLQLRVHSMTGSAAARQWANAFTYADLHTVDGAVDKRGATREIHLRLTGSMQRFIWGFDGKKFSEAQPVHFDHGERLRIVLSNDTMMAHPIHLHGMFGELEAGNGDVMVRRPQLLVGTSGGNRWS
ncbi:Oxidoreductase, partial [Streptococcus thermophilus CNCM I-1630]